MLMKLNGQKNYRMLYGGVFFWRNTFGEIDQRLFSLRKSVNLIEDCGGINEENQERSFFHFIGLEYSKSTKRNTNKDHFNEMRLFIGMKLIKGIGPCHTSNSKTQNCVKTPIS
jgi:hypothetical protein